MKKISIDSAIQPKSLSESARTQLTDQLYAVHARIFDGVDKAAFRRYVIEPDTVLTKIFLFRNLQQEIVGYLTFQVFQTGITRNGKLRKPYVFRTETGLLKEYRGGAPITPILVRECWKFSLRRGMPEAYFLATPINPVAYAIGYRNAAELYPRPGVPTPDHVLQIMDSLTDSLGLQQASETNSFVKQVGWRVRLDAVRMRRLERSRDAGIRFYLEQNPGFVEGHGMMMLAPATVGNGLRTAGKQAKRMLHGRFRKFVFRSPRVIRPILAAML
jgi:hypothetical protein